MVIDVKGKNILFIGIGFYDYEQCILHNLESRGAFVSYFSSDIYVFGKGPLHRIGLHQLATKLVSKKLERQIINQPLNIDLIIIIKGYNFLNNHAALLRKRYPKSPVVLYLWDSLDRLYNKELLLTLTANIFTFDRKDALKYNLSLRPLFARSITRNVKENYKYDISFVGEDHSIRYQVLQSLIPEFDRLGIKYRFILTTTKLWKFIGIYITRRINKLDADLFRTQTIPYQEYLQLLDDSNVILDISHPKQSGLTMRTIETIGMGKKILTTNGEIAYYNFPKEMFHVIDTVKPQIDLIFLKSHFFSKYDVSNYTLDKFVDDILGISNIQ